MVKELIKIIYKFIKNFFLIINEIKKVRLRYYNFSKV